MQEVDGLGGVDESGRLRSPRCAHPCRLVVSVAGRASKARCRREDGDEMTLTQIHELASVTDRFRNDGGDCGVGGDDVSWFAFGKVR